MRDEYTLSTIYGENCGQRVAAMQVEGGGWLVAPKIARINIRARHCHSVNFPRCWLCTASERRTGTVLLVAAKQRGGRREGTKGKTQISLPLPSLLSMEFYALRVFDAARTRGSAAFSLHPPLWLTLTRYFDDTRSANTERRIRVPSA